VHDDINQQVATLSIALSGLKRRLPANAPDVHEPLDRVQPRPITLADEIRRLSHELHPGVLQHAGLVAALEAHCAEVGSQHAIAVTFSAAAGAARGHPAAGVVLHRQGPGQAGQTDRAHPGAGDGGAGGRITGRATSESWRM